MSGEAGSATIKPSQRIRHMSIAFVGMVCTSAMLLAWHGSKWPTASFVLGGTFLPVVIASLLAQLRVRWADITALFLVLLTLGVVAYIGKHPNPATVYREAFGNAPPASVTQLHALRGWFDGPVAILRFQMVPTAVPSLIPAKADAVEDLLAPRIGSWDKAPGQQVSDASWRWAMGLGYIVDPSLAHFPGWKLPRATTWANPDSSGNGHGGTVHLAWDAATGEAILVHTIEPD